MDIVDKFLKQHGHPTAHNRTVRTDKGGELWGSQDFRKLINDHGYLMDPTAPQASFQNGMAERPNCTFGKMVRSLLHGAGLGPEYWSFALLHAAFIKNRIRHSVTNQVPYTMYTGTRPSAKRLRVFGCPIIVRNMGPRPAKLDINTTVGTFLGYTATDKNVIYMDSVTKKIKTATHVIFDEAGYTLPAAQLTPSAKALQQFSCTDTTNPVDDTQPADTQTAALPTSNNMEAEANVVPDADITADPTSLLQVKCLSLHATIPTRATDGSAGYDLYSAVDIVRAPHTRCCVPLDITFVPPIGTYGQILSRSGLAAKHSVDVKAGTIDPDYTGNVTVLLENNGDKPFIVAIGHRIAQLVLYNIQNPKITQVSDVRDTTRGDHGFGSTGVADLPLRQTQHILTPANNTDTPCVRTNTALTERPYDIYFSHDPFDSTLEVEIAVKGDHPTLGILSQYDSCRQRLQIKDMALGTPGSRLKKWRSTL